MYVPLFVKNVKNHKLTNILQILNKNKKTIDTYALM